MIKPLTNPCTRCGQERILLREWIEEIPTFGNKMLKIKRATNVCPDPECQKIIEVELAVQKQKRDKIKQSRELKVAQSKKDQVISE